jgi:hypothetical protein
MRECPSHFWVMLSGTSDITAFEAVAQAMGRGVDASEAVLCASGRAMTKCLLKTTFLRGNGII